MEMIVFSQTCYSLHYSTEGYLFALLATVSMIFAEMSLQQSTTSGVWLSYYPWFFSRLRSWYLPWWTIFLRFPRGSFIWDDNRFPQQSISSQRHPDYYDASSDLVFWSDGLWGYIYSRFDHSESLAERLLGFMESLSDHFSRLKVVTSCYTRAYILPHHFLTDWCSKPPYLLSFGFQSHHSFSVRCSKPPSLLSLGVQSHHLFSIRNSEPLYLFSYDI